MALETLEAITIQWSEAPHVLLGEASLFKVLLQTTVVDTRPNRTETATTRFSRDRDSLLTTISHGEYIRPDAFQSRRCR
jgi:hypothetical protein